MVKQNKKKVKVMVTAKGKAARKREMTRLGSALRALGGLGGTAVGGLIGMPQLGAAHGTSLGAALSKWLGSGDYHVSKNSIVERTLKGSDSIPSMHAEGQSVVIRHKEFLGEIRGKIAFTVGYSFPINPGSPDTFPWLSQVASRFQEYKIKGMVFHYVPSSGTAVSSTNAALGTVMMQTSYRANDTPPSSKIEVLNEFWSSESVPSEPFCHPIECDPKENPFNIQYIRNTDVIDGDNVLMYDLGQTHVCVSGQQIDDGVLGDLWVSYEIELKKPIVASNVTVQSRVGYSVYSPGSPSQLFNSLTSQIGDIKVVGSGRSITFPKRITGVYLVTCFVVASTSFTSLDFSGTTTYTNCDNFPFPGGASYYRTVMGGTAPTLNTGFYTTVVAILDPSRQATIALPSGLTWTGTASAAYLTITPFNVYT